MQPAGGEPRHEALAKVDTLKAELEEFAAACAGRATFGVRPDEAIHGVAVLEAMVASAGAGGAPIGL